MKIGPAADKPVLPPNVGSSGKASTASPAAAPVSPTTPAGSPTDGTTVALSPAAESLRATAASPEFDAEKVERISSAISEGRFQVNPDVIADRLIANARELLERGGN